LCKLLSVTAIGVADIQFIKKLPKSVIVGAIGLLAYLCYDANLFTVKDFFNSSSIKEDMKWVAGIGAAVALLLLSVPGLILLWMSEVGHEIAD
jgi:hypothetical protein